MVMVVMVVVKDDDGDGKEEEFVDVKFLSFFGRRLWRWLAEGWPRSCHQWPVYSTPRTSAVQR